MLRDFAEKSVMMLQLIIEDQTGCRGPKYR